MGLHDIYYLAAEAALCLSVLGLSNGHEDAYNEILSTRDLLPASHSTLDPELRPRWCEDPGCACPAFPSAGAYLHGI